MSRRRRRPEVPSDPAAAVRGAAPPPSEAATAEPPPKAEAAAQNFPALEAARKSVEDAAAISGGLWLSYLFALFYIGIAAAGVTYRDLLLENPVKLPFLNVELPLVAFFFLAPILFVIVHAYTLVHFVLLAAKVGAYNTELGDGDRNDAERRPLPSNIFVQFLAGPDEIRKGDLGWLLRAIAWISLVVGPLFLLLLIQVQFLPYHLEWVTWVQRLAVLADVILLWALWPAVLAGRSRIERWPRFWRHRTLTLARLIAIGLAVTARLPREWLDERIGNHQWIPANAITAWLGATDQQDKPAATPFHDLLFNGSVDFVTQRRKSLFSNTLVLPSFDLLEAKKIDDEKKLEWAKHTLSLRRRHLEGAVFPGADLRKADLTGAYLQGASLALTELQEASLNGAQLQGASLRGAQLQGTSLSGAQLQGVWLFGAQLQGASLNGARLEGAWLRDAQLQGASLYGAQLQGASLDGAQLQGASLNDAQLQGASLNDAQLQGASLNGARLQGASLYGAQLQGADFGQSTFVGTNMQGAGVWRTNFAAASLTAVLMNDFKESPVASGDFAALQAEIAKDARNEAMRNAALGRVGILDPSKNDPGTDVHEIQNKGVDLPNYQKALVQELKTVACSGDDSAALIVRGLYRVNFPYPSRILDTGPFASKLAESILAPDCPVSTALTDEDRAALKKIADRTKPPQTSTPKQ